jgi:hypothetical protein
MPTPVGPTTSPVQARMPFITVVPDRTTAGGPLTVVGSDWGPGEEVTISMISTIPTASGSIVLAIVFADALGRFQLNTTVPERVIPGVWQVYAQTRTPGRFAAASVSVIDVTATALAQPTPTALPTATSAATAIPTRPPPVRPPQRPTATRYVPPPPTWTPPPMPTVVPPQITDWRGEYFANIDLAGTPALVRNDPAISFDWGFGSPAPGLPADFFSVRWSRQLTFDSGTYRFQFRVDDGVRMYIDNVLVLNDWREGPPRDVFTDVTLFGTRNFRVEYFERTGQAVIQMTIFKLQPVPPSPFPTSTATPPPPPTWTPIPTWTPLPTAIPPAPTATFTPRPLATATPTAIPLPPTATATRIPAATATSTTAPLPTATATATSIPLPPTATATATTIPLPPTATATATTVPLPPTATATATLIPPTATATATATEPAPTATATATATQAPTAEPTETPTSPPPDEPTPTATATTAPEATPTPTETPTVEPPTATPTDEPPTATPTAATEPTATPTVPAAPVITATLNANTLRLRVVGGGWPARERVTISLSVDPTVSDGETITSTVTNRQGRFTAVVTLTVAPPDPVYAVVIDAAGNRVVELVAPAAR